MNGIIPRGLVVSCQALRNEPMYGGNTIPKMAAAALLGGAVGIRANTVRDINAIHRYIGGKLPIIGLIKRDYPDSSVYITPTLREARALAKADCSVIALDATFRRRPGGVTTAQIVNFLRENCDKALMADIATLDEAVAAEQMGFDYVSTTLRSYTEETAGAEIPDAEFCRELKQRLTRAVAIAEGGIHTFEELRAVLDAGIRHVIIGGAITRPQNITRDYVKVFEERRDLLSAEGV